jgi:putative ABC transport system substrate-binding protein
MTTRRSFLAGAGAALFAAPDAVRAQAQRPKRLAIMDPVRPIAEMRPDGHPRFIAFHNEMKRLGWREGANLVTEFWSGAGRSDRDEFVRQVYASRPEVVIVTAYGQLTQQLLREATSIPTVVQGPDPLATGIVKSLSRPGGMITGFSTDGGIELVGKRLQLLVEGLPGVRRVAYYGPPYRWALEQSAVRSAAAQLGIALEPALFENGASEAEMQHAFMTMAAARPDAVLVTAAPENGARVKLIAELTLAARLPAIGYQREFPEAGLLMGYGPNYANIFRDCAGYVDRILRGTKPADLPVQQPREFEFLINLKTAREIGIELPANTLALVNEVIE